MSRPMTPQEKQDYAALFPNLNVNNVVVTGEATPPALPKYNCIAWTLGITSRVIWPGPTIQNFDATYATGGFFRSGNGPIAAWGISLTQMKHGSISGPGHGPRWESKLGTGGLRAQHGLGELVGIYYGNVLAFYAPKAAARNSFQRLLKELQIVPRRKSYLSGPESKALREEIARIPIELRRKFEERFAAWQKTWDAPYLMIHSDPTVFRYSGEFAELAALGTDVLPLVVSKLANPNDFLALQLYDALQNDQSLRVDLAPGDEQVFYGEQGRAERVVKRWLGK